jgi:hypothetical protein
VTRSGRRHAARGPEADALSDEVKKTVADVKKTFRGDGEVQVYRSKTDRTLLVIAGKRSGIGREHFVHFSRTGTLQQRFTIDG